MASMCSPYTPTYCSAVQPSGYDPVGSCLSLSPPCPRLYSSSAPVNLNNADGYGLTTSMGWAASSVALLACLSFLIRIMDADLGRPGPVGVAETVQRAGAEFGKRTGAVLGAYGVVMFAAMCGFLYDSTDVMCGFGGIWKSQAMGCNQYVGAPSLKTTGVFTGLCFLTGGGLAATTAAIGVWVATRSSARTVKALEKSVNAGLQVAFKSGAISGLVVVSVGLMGLQICFLILTIKTEDLRLVWQYLAGFGLGASTVTLFLRISGGIFARAATMGAMATHRIDSSIPEANPTNSATIAKDFGEIISYVAASNADIFETTVGAIIAACILGYATYSKLNLTEAQFCCLFGADASAMSVYDAQTNFALSAVAYPLWLTAIGILGCTLGALVVHTPAAESMADSHALIEMSWAVRRGKVVATVFYVGMSCLVSWIFFGNSGEEWRAFGCCLIGVFYGSFVSRFTECFASNVYTSTRSGVAQYALIGNPMFEQAGWALGMIYTGIPLLLLVAVLIASSQLQSAFGIAISAVSMASIATIHLAAEAFVPVAFNAHCIAKTCKSDFKEVVQDRILILDALASLSSAKARAYSISLAALTSVALILAFVENAGLTAFEFDYAVVFAGIFIGVALVFVFLGTLIVASNRTTLTFLQVVKHQFDQEPLLKNYDVQGPLVTLNAQDCVAICTRRALHESAVPISIPMFAPFIVGYLLGSQCLMGMLIGIVTTGSGVGISFIVAASVWDSADRFIKQRGLGEGRGEGSVFQKDSEAPTRVGPLFLTTLGPALSVFMKSTVLLSIVLSPSFKAINPSGGVFPNANFWIGIIIFVVLLLVLFTHQLLVNHFYQADDSAMERFNLGLHVLVPVPMRKVSSLTQGVPQRGGTFVRSGTAPVSPLGGSTGTNVGSGPIVNVLDISSRRLPVVISNGPIVNVLDISSQRLPVVVSADEEEEETKTSDEKPIVAFATAVASV